MDLKRCCTGTGKGLRMLLAEKGSNTCLLMRFFERVVESSEAIALHIAQQQVNLKKNENILSRGFKGSFLFFNLLYEKYHSKLKI